MASVTKHPSPGQRDGWAGRNPAVGANRNPIGMDGGCVWLELHHLLLLSIHEPPLATNLGGTVLVAGLFLRHVDNLTETPLRPAVEVAVSRLTEPNCMGVNSHHWRCNPQFCQRVFWHLQHMIFAFSGLLGWRA